MNNVAIAGRLVADPELKVTPNGVETTTFRIAVEREYKTGEEKKADFFDIVCWRKTAAFVCKYFKKGKPIGIIGRLQSRTYQVKDGTNRYVVEIVADSVEFVIGDKAQITNTSHNQTPTYNTPVEALQAVPDSTAQQIPMGEDLPF